MQSFKGLTVIFLTLLLFHLNLHSISKAEAIFAFDADSNNEQILQADDDNITTSDPITVTSDPMTATNDSTTITSDPTIITSDPTITTNDTTTTTSDATITISDTSTTTTASSTSTTSTSLPDPTTVDVCDFSNKSCLVSGDEYVTITDGRKFAEDIDGDISQPPKGPVSSAASVLEPAVNNERCHIPYNMSLLLGNASANWDMYFCYKDQCLSANSSRLNCSSGTYGLIPFIPGEEDKIITMSVNHSSQYHAQANAQCLRYYYYIPTSNDRPDWNKTIEVYINNETHLIDTVTTANMTTNSWKKSTVNMNASTNIYNISFKFKIVNISSTETSSNEPIYFALDNIQLSNRDCSYAPENTTTGSSSTMSSTTPPTISSTTTSTVSSTTTTIPSPSNKSNIPLILGLSLGLGIPLILVTIAFIVYYIKVHHREKKYRKNSTASDKVPRIYSNDRYDSHNEFLTTTF
ncbi:unnamed protein product [Adineta steineri]|uniref:MAM domain-containing protein n=1 Tax=Adineta steineri TaxID=433720 RepID=A0A819NNF9_9BILA|nr:unnamed protein product [Adineta steineri]